LDKKLALKKVLNKKSLIVFLLVFILAITFFLLKKELVVASVNGQPIFRLSLIREMEKTFGKQSLEGLIGKTLVFQEAKKQNVTVGKQEIDQEIAKIEESFKSQNQDLNQFLSSQGLKRADLEEQVKLQKIAEKLAQSTESAKIQEWFTDLRGKAQVNYYKEF